MTRPVTPRFRDQLLTKPKFSHMRAEADMGWLAHVKAEIEEDCSDGPSTSANVDSRFKLKLNEPFGEISP